MINEEKIRLMTDVALFEKRNRAEISDCRYRRRDFFAMHSLRIWTILTLVYGGILLLAVLYAAGEGIQLIMVDDSLIQGVLWWGIGYVIFCFAGFLSTGVYLRRRYARAVAGMHRLKELLRCLEEYYRERSSSNDNDASGFSSENQ